MRQATATKAWWVSDSGPTWPLAPIVGLQWSEHDSLVSRAVRPMTSTAVEYALTDVGRSFGPPVAALIAKAQDKHHLAMEAPQSYHGSPASPRPDQGMTCGRPGHGEGDR